jgi:hypothetical protein
MSDETADRRARRLRLSELQARLDGLRKDDQDEADDPTQDEVSAHFEATGQLPGNAPKAEEKLWSDADLERIVTNVVRAERGLDSNDRPCPSRQRNGYSRLRN